MKRLLSGLIALCLLSPLAAWAQTEGAVTPGTAGTRSGLIGCYYPASTPAPAAGQQMAISCDVNGKLVVSATTSPTGTQDVNLTQVAGVAVATGHGTAAGALRVELPTDGTGQVTVSGVATAANQVTAQSSLTNIESYTSRLLSSAGPATPGAVPAPTTFLLGGLKYNAAPLTFVDGDTGSFQGDANGYLKVNIAAGAAAGGTSSTFGAAFPGPGTAAGYNDGTNMQGARVFDLDSGAGAEYGLGVNLRSAGSGGSAETGVAANPLRVDPTGTTTQPVSLTNAGPATGTLSSVSGATSSTTLLAANASRKGATIYNDSNAALYIALSATAVSATAFTYLLNPGGSYELPLVQGGVYTGQISGIWTSATGAARITELQ